MLNIKFANKPCAKNYTFHGHVWLILFSTKWLVLLKSEILVYHLTGKNAESTHWFYFSGCGQLCHMRYAYSFI